jgi:hypothetical protein
MRVLIGPLVSSNSSSVYDRTVSCGVRQEDMKSHETLSVVVLRVSFIFASGLLLVLLNIDAIAQFPGRKRKQLLDVVRLSSQSKDNVLHSLKVLTSPYHVEPL